MAVLTQAAAQVPRAAIAGECLTTGRDTGGAGRA